MGDQKIGRWRVNRALFLYLAVLLAAAQEQPSILERAKAKADEWITLERAVQSGGIDRQRLLADIERFLAENADKEFAYGAAAYGYNRLSRNAEALRAIRQYRTKFPESAALDETVQFFVVQYGDLAELRGLPSRFRSSPEYWLTLMHKATEASERAGAARSALETFNSGNDPDGDGRAGFAEDMLALGLDPRLAEQAAVESLKAGEISSPPHHFPRNLSEEMMKSVLRMFSYSVHRATLGAALAARGRHDEALRELSKAAEIVESKHLRTHSRVFYRLGVARERTGESSAAIDAYVREIATGGRESKSARAALDRLLPSEGGGENLAGRINEAAALWAQADPNNQEVEEMNAGLGRFELLTYSGRKPFDWASLKGKIVIIDFWASWCASCRPSLASSAKLQREFPDDIAVVAPAADLLDTQEAAAKFLASRGYTRFIHLVDDPARRTLQAPWIPARFAVDREGRVRLQELGASEQGLATFEGLVRRLVSNR